MEIGLTCIVLLTIRKSKRNLMSERDMRVTKFYIRELTTIGWHYNGVNNK